MIKTIILIWCACGMIFYISRVYRIYKDEGYRKDHPICFKEVLELIEALLLVLILWLPEMIYEIKMHQYYKKHSDALDRYCKEKIGE